MYDERRGRMTYALVSFAFIGGWYDEKKYLFKTDIKGLVLGDVVEVEGRNEGETTIAVFSKYVAEDSFPGRKRKVILKKVDKNILKSVMKIRVELFKDVEIPKGIYDYYRKGFKKNGGLSDKKLRVKIIRNLSVAAYRFSPQKNANYYYFGKEKFVVKDGVIYTIMHEKKVKWIRPNLLDEIAERYIEQFVTD